MPRSKPPPPFPPRETPEPEGRGRASQLDPLDLDFGSDSAPPRSKRQTLPVPGPAPAPASGTPTRPSGGGIGTRSSKRPALERQPTRSGLGIPGPAEGSDTDFDPEAGGDPWADFEPNPLRQTTSFERSIERSFERDAALNVPRRAPPPPPPSNAPGSRGPATEASRATTAAPTPLEPPARTDVLGDLRERYALGDFSGALELSERILEREPKNADALRYAESCREVLHQMYAARLGPLDRVPVVAVPPEQLRWLTLDHRSGFLLSHVDGVSTLEEILDVSGMPPLDALKILFDLLQQKVIALP
jgi:hypothetical protein